MKAYRVWCPSPPPIQRQQRLDAALSVGWKSVAMLARAAGCSRVYARQVLQRAHQAGRIERARLRLSHVSLRRCVCYRRR